LAVFTVLGLAAVLMASFALVQATRFVIGSDSIAAALARHDTSLANSAPTSAGKPVVTNVAAPASARSSTRTADPGKV
jgi:hypothetical protein